MAEDYVLEYNLKPQGKVLQEFSDCRARNSMIMGPLGCLRGDTKVFTEYGLLPISDINRPMQILGWDDSSQKFRLSPSGGSFPKGRDYLYRVTTTQGVFAAH